MGYKRDNRAHFRGFPAVFVTGTNMRIHLIVTFFERPFRTVL